MDYQNSVDLALALGYVQVPDENAYQGCYFVKNEKKWIHDIEALKRKLGVISDDDLVALNYDLENYHSYKDHTNEMVQNEMKELYNSITQEDGEATYLCDGMWLLPNGSIVER